jgi:hypothetical protein
MTKALSPLATELKNALAGLKFQKSLVAALRIKVAAEREALKTAKAESKADKQAAAIAKAQARLEKLLSKQAGLVGAKAAKANRRPGKATVTTFGAEDNAIAQAIMAKKQKASA